MKKIQGDYKAGDRGKMLFSIFFGRDLCETERDHMEEKRITLLKNKWNLTVFKQEFTVLAHNDKQIWDFFKVFYELFKKDLNPYLLELCFGFTSGKMNLIDWLIIVASYLFLPNEKG